jgi:hypothetical protein
MDLGGVVMAAVDAAGGSELGLLGGSRLPKHGRGNASGGEDHGWGGGRAKQARVADVSEAAAAAAPFLLGSCSPGHGGEHMLSFSSAASSCHSATATAGGAAADAAMPLYYGTPASCSGEDGGRPVVQSFFSVFSLLDWIWSLEKLAIYYYFPSIIACRSGLLSLLSLRSVEW